MNEPALPPEMAAEFLKSVFQPPRTRKARAKKPLVHELLVASMQLEDLAQAFRSGTWAGVHAYARKHNVFKQLAGHSCSKCGQQVRRRDDLNQLLHTIQRAYEGVMSAEKRRAEEPAGGL